MMAAAEGVTLADLKTDEEKLAEEAARVREFAAIVKGMPLDSLITDGLERMQPLRSHSSACNLYEAIL